MNRTVAQGRPRIPEACGGIQVNFCKNPKCSNFGVPASMESHQSRGPYINPEGRDKYNVASSRGIPILKCLVCNEYPSLKSNLAIHEELTRITDYLKLPAINSCPDNACDNHTVDISKGVSAYHSFGKTRSGSHRYRCQICKKTFSVGVSTLHQKKPHKNIEVFRLLVNKMPLKRICEVADISMPTLYDKIDFLHRQCLAFAADREKRLISGTLPIKRLYIAVDRQDYLINWNKTLDKRNVALSAVGSADNVTGYVFGINLSFDPALKPDDIEREAIRSGDYEKYPSFRKFARLWLDEDYKKKAERGRYFRFNNVPLAKEIKDTYDEAVERDDVESSETFDDTIKLPSNGMQVHAEYTLYAHFLFLKQMLGGVEKVRFFLDQESGIRAACLSAFCEEIRQGRCDAFYVRISKDLTVDERKKALAESRKEWNTLKRSYPDLSDSGLKLLIIKKHIEEMKVFGKWQDRWIKHPFPDMGEPEKAACYLTDTGRYDDDHLAWLYNKASLHAIDRFFMQVRRRISLLERPVTTSSSFGRRWYGYSPYNPEMITKVLDIFRVFYNYIEVGKDKGTPAMRLGLAKGKVGVEDVVYYR